MKHVEIVLRTWEGRTRGGMGVNLIQIYYRHVWKYQLKYAGKCKKCC
jgi:hypothetical protein